MWTEDYFHESIPCYFIYDFNDVTYRVIFKAPQKNQIIVNYLIFKRKFTIGNNNNNKNNVYSLLI